VQWTGQSLELAVAPGHSQRLGGYVTEPEGGGVFVSYRRQDSGPVAGRLYDRLAFHFGPSRVFIDVDTIEPGVDFAEAIALALETCEVLLAIIGPGWLAAADESGLRRLEDPDDIVRIEIEAALARNVRVIPILMENAVMPKRQDLPESLARLARRNALTVRHDTFRYDADRLVATIEGVIGARDQEQQTKGAEPRPRPKSSVAEPEEWRLALVDSEGGETTFHLSSGPEAHVIVVHLTELTEHEWIDVDGERVGDVASIHGKRYSLNGLGSKLGSGVTIMVKRSQPVTQILSLELMIGDQILSYKA